MKNIIRKISSYLQSLELVEFAVLFGSFSQNNQSALSDIDIGLYFSKEIELLKLGNIIAELVSISGHKIDTAILNNLYKKDPFLANEILSKGKILFCKNERLFIDYKKRYFLIILILHI